MADIRTSYTATSLRGFAAMPKAKRMVIATKGGVSRGRQSTRAAARRAVKLEARLVAERRERATHTARIKGRCTATLAPALIALACSPLTLAPRTRLDAYEISEPRARILRRRGLAKIRQLASSRALYITELGRRVAKDTL